MGVSDCAFMNYVFRDWLQKFVVVCLDNILIYSKNITEHVQHVQHVQHVYVTLLVPLTTDA